MGLLLKKHQVSESIRMSSEAPVKREKKPFKKQMYRGHELDKLLAMGREQIVALMGSRQRRRFRHGFSSKYDRLVKKVRIAKRDSVPGEKPKSVKLISETPS